MGVRVTAERTLAGQQHGLSAENRWLRGAIVLEAAVAAGCLVGGAAVRAAGGTWTPVTLGAMLAFLATAHAYKRRENFRQQRIIASGQQGEARITRLLERDLDDTCYILNDVIVPFARRTAQVDHLVVSPQGIFLFETKNWSGRLSGDAEAQKWTQHRTRDGKRLQLSNPVRQARRQGEFMRQFLAARGMDSVHVYPAVVFSNPRTTWDAHSGEVPILRPDEIPSFVFAVPADPAFTFRHVRSLVHDLSGKELV